MIGAPNRQAQGAYSSWMSGGAASTEDPSHAYPGREWIRQYVMTAEALGFDSIWMGEHTVLPTQYKSRYPYQAYQADQEFARYPLDEAPFPEPLTMFAFMAAITNTVRFRTAVMVLPKRNPVLLANELATLDVLSASRIDLGVGMGWWKEEFEAMGVPWEGRGRRADEYIEAMRTLWANEIATYEGTTVSFDRVRLNPRPLRGSVPIIIGGHTEAAVRRTVKLGDGIMPLNNEDADWAPLIGMLEREAERAGREPASISRYAGVDANLEDVERLSKLGVTDFYIVTPPGPVDAACDFMAATAERMQQYL